MIRRLAQRFIREQDGIALVMAIAAMCVLAIATTGVIVAGTANEETAWASTQGRSAFAAAQLALAYGEGLVYADVANGTDPTNDTPYNPTSRRSQAARRLRIPCTRMTTSRGRSPAPARWGADPHRERLCDARADRDDPAARDLELPLRDQQQSEQRLGRGGDQYADPHRGRLRREPAPRRRSSGTSRSAITSRRAATRRSAVRRARSGSSRSSATAPSTARRSRQAPPRATAPTTSRMRPQ